MFEKVNPAHPDKIADRIAGAIVDLAYRNEKDPKVAVEVLIGHNRCFIIIESSYKPEWEEVCEIVKRITSNPRITIRIVCAPQDKYLALNQQEEVRCGDNGIFRGVPVTEEQKQLITTAHNIYMDYFTDGKYILDGEKLVICQSNARAEDLKERYPDAIINPLGYWTGGTDVDSGATNRKLGSDMGDSVTGGGLHGKDLSKADVSVNIYAFLKAQQTGKTVELSCAIGDEEVDGRPYAEIVEIARNYINEIGGFEAFAKWGLLR